MTDCIVCFAKDYPRYLRDKPADETIVALPVHRGCKRDAETAIRFWNEGVPFKNGAYRWKSNGHIPHRDMHLLWVALGYITADDAEASLKVGKAESDAFLKAYRKNPPKPTAEDLFEMRAAFGEGAEVVNIITGKVTKL
jgi:hypothetical protein